MSDKPGKVVPINPILKMYVCHYMIRLQIQSDGQDNALDIVKGAIAAEIKRLEIGLHRTEQQIAAHESRYAVTSDTFQRGFIYR